MRFPSPTVLVYGLMARSSFSQCSACLCLGVCGWPFSWPVCLTFVLLVKFGWAWLLWGFAPFNKKYVQIKKKKKKVVKSLEDQMFFF